MSKIEWWIKFFAILGILGSIYVIWLGINFISLVGAISMAFMFNPILRFLGFGGYGALILILGILQLIFYFGLYKLKKWGWLGVIILLFISLFFIIIQAFYSFAAILENILQLILALILIPFLLIKRDIFR